MLFVAGQKCFCAASSKFHARKKYAVTELVSSSFISPPQFSPKTHPYWSKKRICTCSFLRASLHDIHSETVIHPPANRCTSSISGNMFDEISIPTFILESEKNERQRLLPRMKNAVSAGFQPTFSLPTLVW